MADLFPQLLDINQENGDPERIRTADPQIRNLMLYPAELRGRIPRYRQFAAGREPFPVERPNPFWRLSAERKWFGREAPQPANEPSPRPDRPRKARRCCDEFLLILNSPRA